jgi:hypothetical protein
MIGELGIERLVSHPVGDGQKRFERHGQRLEAAAG